MKYASFIRDDDSEEIPALYEKRNRNYDEKDERIAERSETEHSFEAKRNITNSEASCTL